MNHKKDFNNVFFFCEKKRNIVERLPFFENGYRLIQWEGCKIVLLEHGRGWESNSEGRIGCRYCICLWKSKKI